MPGAPEEVDTTEPEGRASEPDSEDRTADPEDPAVEPGDQPVEPDAQVRDGDEGLRSDFGHEPNVGSESNSFSGEETSAASTPAEPEDGSEEVGSRYSLTTHERLAVGRSLLVLQQTLSERYWGGGWVKGFEYELWEMGTEGAPLPEGVEIDAAAGAASAEPADLCVLAELCGGWWTWEDGPVFVPLGEWERRVRVRRLGLDPRADAATDAGAVTVPGGVAAQE